MNLLSCFFQQVGLKVSDFCIQGVFASISYFTGPPMPPINPGTPGTPKKRFSPTMITSPDGKGIIMSGGFILTGPNGWSKEYLTTLMELRLNGSSNEFYWTVMNQTMKIPREGPVMFNVPDDYCVQHDFINHSEHASVTWIRLTIAGSLIFLALLSIMAYVARRHWNNIKEKESKKKKINIIFRNEGSTQQMFEENNPTYEQICGIEVSSLPQLFVGNIEKGELIGKLYKNICMLRKTFHFEIFNLTHQKRTQTP